MSKKYARVVRYDFDSMENRIENAVLQKELVLFGDDETATAAEKAKEFVAGYVIERREQGWDKREYPRLEIEEGELK